MLRSEPYGGRLEDTRLLTGRGRYVADIVLERMAHAYVLRTPYAHADIKSIDVAAARAAPGVLAVLTAADLAADGIDALACGVEHKRPDGSKAFQARRPVLAKDRVRCVGEAVALVVGETLAAAQGAAELIEIDYDPLPAVASAEAAVASDAPKVWEPVGDNIAFVWSGGKVAEAKAAIAAASRVIRLKSHISRVTATPIESRGAVAEPEPGGRLVLHHSNQSPYGTRNALATLLKIPPDRIRLVARDVGGSFGMKAGLFPEDVLVLWAARRLGRPVRWIADRSESFLSDDHGRDVGFEAALALDADNRFAGLYASFDINVGCYLSGRSMGLLNNVGGIAGVYRIPVIGADVRGVFTHTQITSPYRGAGRPEATYVIERLVDLAAREAGMDPFELRLRNLVPPAAMPYDTGFLFKYDCGEFEENMRAAARLADRDGYAERRKASAAQGRLRGLGICNPIEVAGGPFLKPGKDFSRLEVAADGSVEVRVGAMSVGQGLETAMTRLVATRLGVPVERVRYRQGDTDLLPAGRGSGGSSGLGVGGTVVVHAVDKLIATARALAAEMLEASEDKVGFEDGRFPLTGTNRSVGLADVARLAAARSPDGLAAGAEWQPPAVTFPNGCHMCEVEIDPATGAVEIQRYAIVEDVGNVLNPELVHGQMHGGVAQGVAQALGEAVSYDADSAQLLTGTLMDYMLPRAEDLPTLSIETRAVPTKVNPLGVKGVGEAGTVGSLAATINAVCDALAPLGIRHIEMPATPARIWAAIQDARKSS